MIGAAHWDRQQFARLQRRQRQRFDQDVSTFAIWPGNPGGIRRRTVRGQHRQRAVTRAIERRARIVGHAAVDKEPAPRRCLFDRAHRVDGDASSRHQTAPWLQMQRRQFQPALLAPGDNALRHKTHILVQIGLWQIIFVIGDAPAAARRQGVRLPAGGRGKLGGQVEHDLQRRADGRRVVKVRALVKVQSAQCQVMLQTMMHCLHDLLWRHAELAVLLPGLPIGMCVHRHTWSYAQPQAG